MSVCLKLVFLSIFLFLGLYLSATFAAAADRYWVGGTADWDAIAGTKWATTSGGAGGAAVPTAADDVYFDANSGTGTVTLTTSATINSLDMNGFAGTLVHNAAVTLTIDSSNSSNHSLRLASGMTYTLGNAATSAINFTATASGNTVTTAGKSLGNITFSGSGGGWTLQDSLTAGSTATLTLTAGTLDTNNQAISVGIFNSNNANTRTLTLGSSQIELTGTSTTVWNCASQNNLTIDTGTSVITISGSSSGFNQGRSSGGTNKTFYDVRFTGGGSAFVTSASAGLTFGSLTYTGTASVSDSFGFDQGRTYTITGALTINGNSASNRVLVSSFTTGSSVTLNNTGATVSASNVDFKDIDLSVAADLSAITGGSGDAGGNTDITFTLSQTNYWVGGTGNWSDVNEWASSSGGVAGSGRVPLPQDDVRFDASSFSASSQAVTMDMPRTGRDLDFTGVTNNPQLTKTSGLVTYNYGSVTLGTGMTQSHANGQHWFEGRGSHTFTANGVAWNWDDGGFDMAGGTMTLMSAAHFTNDTVFRRGTFDANGFSVTCFSCQFPSTFTEVKMGSGTWTATRVGTPWNMNAAVTVTPGTSTVVVSNTTTSAKTFAGAGKTYYNVIFSGDNITITGDNTFNNFAVHTAGFSNGLKITSGSTQIINGTFSANGSAGSLANLVSSSAGSAGTLSKSSGTVSVDYMSIQDSAVTGGASWYAGANSTSVSGNTGWVFTDPPSGGGAATSTPKGGTIKNGKVKIKDGKVKIRPQ